jgi:hypothetical protein
MSREHCEGLHWTRSDSAAALAWGGRGARPGPDREAVKLFDRRLSLDALAVRVAGHEILIGPLRALALTAEGTAATFARAPLPPLRAELRRLTGEVLPAGHVRICEGSAWIDGVPAAVVALRRRAD